MKGGVYEQLVNRNYKFDTLNRRRMKKKIVESRTVCDSDHVQTVKLDLRPSAHIKMNMEY